MRGPLDGVRVLEFAGLGPDRALHRNPRLIYGRMTGWGQDGPLAHAAGHDITYIALTGALAAIGPAGGPPVPPLNLAGDFAGGALYLALGILAALYERECSGAGQVIDAAVVDGTASLLALFDGLRAGGRDLLEPGRRLLGGDAPNYRCYECSDGKYVAVARAASTSTWTGSRSPHLHRASRGRRPATPRPAAAREEGRAALRRWGVS